MDICDGRAFKAYCFVVDTSMSSATYEQLHPRGSGNPTHMTHDTCPILSSVPRLLPAPRGAPDSVLVREASVFIDLWS